ncbi:MAG: glycosyltransferase [Algibacter sp.]|uniref:glycosyltransferase n=1 Tax=Algibacter sp. TaxID=1872428 RepID=UPI00260AC119|nr:glycosyltransferase [Algibacter sp.]MDG1729836.1 glycosyltransferase [Algibacter sp.]MDG2177990.1 glycosyltransferase [Algibacter sp.]
MRVLQLIDSLDTGGAERVAVNLANTLSDKVNQSFLCATRKEGILEESLTSDVGYLFLDKQRVVDFKAIKCLNTFVKTNNIDIIHAHSTSFFLATIIKILNKNVHIIWHDHYGNSEFLDNRKFGILKICSNCFSHVFSVNRTLETWAKENLKIKNVTYLPNFATINESLAITKLNGVAGKRIVCLANLRPQKDHFTLIDAFKNIVKLYPNWTLHCVGKDFDDEYSKNIKSKIEKLELNKSVFLYGRQPDIFNILRASDIGVLSSKSEGLPIALLEYGLANLPVIATNVGECELVVLNKVNGLLVNPLNARALEKALEFYILNEVIRKEHAIAFNKHIQENFSTKSQLDNILNIYKSTIK